MSIEKQPEAWIVINKETGYRTQVSYFPDLYNTEMFELIPLYTAPPKREQDSITDATPMAYMPNGSAVSNVYEAYEEGRKSVMFEQEHVGIVRIIGGYPDNSERVVDWVCPYKYLKDGDRLYTAPPKREPLSGEEIYKLSLENFKGLLTDRINFVRAIEKAHGIGGGE